MTASILADNHQIKLTDFGRDSVCTLTPPTTTIAIYYYYTHTRIQIHILPSQIMDDPVETAVRMCSAAHV